MNYQQKRTKVLFKISFGKKKKKLTGPLSFMQNFEARNYREDVATSAKNKIAAASKFKSLT